MDQSLRRKMSRLLIVLLAVLSVTKSAAAQEAKQPSRVYSRLTDPDAPDPICMNEHMKDPQRASQAIQNTKTFYPKVYREMISALGVSGGDRSAVIGERRRFSVFNFRFSRYDLVEAELCAEGASTEIWIQVAEIADGHVDTAVVPYTLLDSFEKRTPSQSKDSTKGIRKLDEQLFGSPPNIGSSGIRGTGNGKVTLLITDIQDEFDSTKGGTYYAGFFDPNDQTLSPVSNRRDMLYIDSYPGISYRGKSRLAVALSVVAHEYEHLIHDNYDRHEEALVDEGLAEYAAYACGYGMNDPREYFSDTNVPLFDWDNISTTVIADYDRARLWTLYIMEQLGDSLARRIVQSPLHGIKGYDDALGQMGSTETFSSLFQTWLVANYLNDRTIKSAYGYLCSSLSRVKPQAEFEGSDCAAAVDSVFVLASKYVRFSGGDSLNIRFTIKEGDILIKAIEVGAAARRVVDVPIGVDFFEPEFGTTYNEIVFVIMNTSAIPAAASGLIGARYCISSSPKTKDVADVHGKQSFTPPGFALSQNYPNPFNSSTIIRYQVSVEGTMDGCLTELKVFDVLGREVATLVNAYQPVGEHTAAFDGRSLPSGEYFYRLIEESPGRARKSMEVKKMILTK